MFITNKSAILGLPVYLIVAIITASGVITILLISSYHISMESQYYEVENEIQKIINEAENMFEYSDDGTLVTIHVEFPNSLKFIVFGDIPKLDNSEPENLTLSENTSNNYYFVMRDGTSKTFHTYVRFSGKNNTLISLLRPGIYDIYLEQSYIRGKSYVKIYR